MSVMERVRQRQQETDGARTSAIERERREHIAGHAGEILARGAIAGFAAGVVFLLIEMAWATRDGLPADAPLAQIATIFTGADQPEPSSTSVVTGLVTHTGLSMAFGIGFAILALGLVPVRRANFLVLAVAGALYGLALYVINFQVFGNLLFPPFASDGVDHWFQIWVHAVYGFLLAPFFFGLARRLWPTD